MKYITHEYILSHKMMAMAPGFQAGGVMKLNAKQSKARKFFSVDFVKNKFYAQIAYIPQF